MPSWKTAVLISPPSVGLRRPLGAASRVGEREGAHGEQVVAVVAFEAQHGLVGVDVELVVAVAALAPPAASCCLRDSQPRVVASVAKTSFGATLAACVALRAVELADLEGVVALAAVQRRDRAVVVGGEVSLPPRPKTSSRPLIAGVVVDPLDRGVGAAACACASVACSRPTKAGRSAISSAPRPAMAFSPAQQEDVVGRHTVPPVAGSMPLLRRVEAVDRQHVDAVVGGAGVQRH